MLCSNSFVSLARVRANPRTAVRSRSELFQPVLIDQCNFDVSLRRHAEAGKHSHEVAHDGFKNLSRDGLAENRGLGVRFAQQAAILQFQIIGFHGQLAGGAPGVQFLAERADDLSFSELGTFDQIALLFESLLADHANVRFVRAQRAMHPAEAEDQ